VTMTNETGKKETSMHRYPYAILKPFRKGELAGHFEVGANVVHNYFAELAHCGILKDLGKYGPNDPRVYAIGWHHEFQPGRSRVVPFLKNTKEMRRALVAFDPYNRERRSGR
jgi:hypothetical protein